MVGPDDGLFASPMLRLAGCPPTAATRSAARRTSSAVARFSSDARFPRRARTDWWSTLAPATRSLEARRVHHCERALRSPFRGRASTRRPRRATGIARLAVLPTDVVNAADRRPAAERAVRRVPVVVVEPVRANARKLQGVKETGSTPTPVWAGDLAERSGHARVRCGRGRARR